MQSSTITAALAAGALLMAGDAFAATGAFHALAKLAGPAPAAGATTIADNSWRCDGETCVGNGPHSALDNPVRQCRKVAAVLGQIAAYEADGLKMSAGDLKACNTAAAKGADANAAK